MAATACLISDLAISMSAGPAIWLIIFAEIDRRAASSPYKPITFIIFSLASGSRSICTAASRPEFPDSVSFDNRENAPLTSSRLSSKDSMDESTVGNYTGINNVLAIGGLASKDANGSHTRDLDILRVWHAGESTGDCNNSTVLLFAKSFKRSQDEISK